MEDEIRIRIATDHDILNARHEGRGMALRLGLSETAAALGATAISELSRNIIQYAGTGEIILAEVHRAERVGIVIAARDQGPGIADLARALEYSHSSSGGQLGLPGTRRVMDEFEITSAPGRGTTVKVTKWRD